MTQSSNANGQIIDINVANLLGEWENVNADPDYISKLSITAAGKGQIALTLHDVHLAKNSLLGKCEAFAFCSPESDQAAGFFSRFEIGNMTTTIAANEKLGVLVLQSYTEFNNSDNNSGIRQNILTREFYRREQRLDVVNSDMLNDPSLDQTTDADAIIRGNTRDEDFSFLRGNWINTNPQSSWVTELVISSTDDEWSANMQTLEQPDRSGKLPLVPFVFDTNEVGFTYRFETGDVVSNYAAYGNKGLIVLSGFHEYYVDGQPVRVMSREFYFNRD